MCQQGCYNEDYWGDCDLRLGYCPIEKKDHINKCMTTCNKSLSIKQRVEKG